MVVVDRSTAVENRVHVANSQLCHVDEPGARQLFALPTRQGGALRGEARARCAFGCGMHRVRTAAPACDICAFDVAILEI